MGMNANRIESDRRAIEATIADYADGWLTGDAERMARCLHPGLAKRALAEPGPGVDPCTLHESPAAAMIAGTREGRGRRHPPGYETTFLDISGEIASAIVVTSPYVDYLHLARCDGRWLIVNALWRPRAADEVR